MVKFIPIPKFPCDPAQLAEFRATLNIPRNLAMFPQQQVLSSGALPAEGSTPKPWRDNSAIWSAAESFAYTVWRGEVNLKLRTMPGDAGIPVVDAEGIGQLEGVYSMQAIAFYNRRFIQSGGREFARIPRLVKVEVARAEAQRLNILRPPSPVDVEWPLAIPTGDAQIPTTINPKIALRFGPTGWPEAFDIDEYERTFPLVTGNLDDAELVDAVESIIASPMSVKEKADAIRKVAR